ncbi:Hypothetical predicted protein [Mytilus galloprovincialis]|uniref:Uncharacterized protein n=1 Tax=Mytilus galloprovincialis TaxID=29158 RepID=A0A8B6DPF7_MYTGA|nr:Hypothetical predicted protein [Mytilus galloprovincialis]
MINLPITFFKLGGSDSTNTVVAYMSTVASIGGVVVIVIAVWRHKEFITKKIRKQKIKFARLQKTTSLVFENEKKVEQKVRKSENPYDDIDEKDMVKDLKDITY